MNERKGFEKYYQLKEKFINILGVGILGCCVGISIAIYLLLNDALEDDFTVMLCFIITMVVISGLICGVVYKVIWHHINKRRYIRVNETGIGVKGIWETERFLNWKDIQSVVIEKTIPAENPVRVFCLGQKESRSSPASTILRPVSTVLVAISSLLFILSLVWRKGLESLFESLPFAIAILLVVAVLYINWIHPWIYTRSRLGKDYEGKDNEIKFGYIVQDIQEVDRSGRFHRALPGKGNGQDGIELLNIIRAKSVNASIEERWETMH